jgi:hypothetical protein
MNTSISGEANSPLIPSRTGRLVVRPTFLPLKKRTWTSDYSEVSEIHVYRFG